MVALRVLCWALIFILRLQFPPGSSIATIRSKILHATSRFKRKQTREIVHASTFDILERKWQ